MLPLVPVIVRAKVPVCGRPPIEMVSVDVPEPVTDDGLKLALTLRGRLLRLKLTVPVKPADGVTVIVLLPLDFAVNVREFGDAESEKFPPPPEL